MLPTLGRAARQCQSSVSLGSPSVAKCPRVLPISRVSRPRAQSRTPGFLRPIHDWLHAGRYQPTSRAILVSTFHGRRFSAQAKASKDEEYDSLSTEVYDLVENAISAIPSDKTLTSAPPGWSIDWDAYPHLMTLFAPGPYYLELPQLDTVLFVEHHVPPGDIVPHAFLTADAATEDFPENTVLVEVGEGVFYLVGFSALGGPATKAQENREEGPEAEDEEDAGGDPRIVYHLSNVSNLDDAIRAITDVKAEINTIPGTRIKPSPEGADMLRRILAEDPTVARDLFEQGFLDYLPGDLEEDSDSMSEGDLGYSSQNLDPDELEDFQVDSDEDLDSDEHFPGLPDAALEYKLNSMRELAASVEEMGYSLKEIDDHPELRQIVDARLELINKHTKTIADSEQL
ncbi:hypothetical protein HGRIS_005727 [Hohenbuehelia grisea]|uniref:Uncharacterized protein n=1 Tax=Hohenbuehelia grisea TaxID=104357 RepID=A0ABR3JXZ7_9AGAR